MSATITVAAPPKPEPQWPWHPCPMCWQQQGWWERGGLMRDTETGLTQRLYFWKDCSTCLGVGTVPESFTV